MSLRQHPAAAGGPTNGDDALAEHLETLAQRYGNRFLREAAPDNELPEHGMRAVDAMRLIGEELVLDGIPMRNLATFVTTWMEPEAQRIIAENLHRNFIDHAEYPQTAEIEQRCIRMHRQPVPRPGGDDRRAHAGLLRGDHARRAVAEVEVARAARGGRARTPTRPNLVFGGDVHVVWEKFCRYFDVEPRIIPLQPDKYTIGPEDVEPHVDENTIGVAAVLGTTFTGHADDIRGINDLLVRLRDERGLDVPLHVDARQRRVRVAVPVPATRSGTSGSSRCARSTSPATSSGWSTRASAGSCSASGATSPRTSSSTRTTSARPTRRSR